jgi:hypothetical protein
MDGYRRDGDDATLMITDVLAEGVLMLVVDLCRSWNYAEAPAA